MSDVILVDLADQPIGRASKEEAHRSGQLHRAFSVFLLDADGRVLVQRRALGKYHSGGLWTNTCCSHPSPGETVAGAARRRIQEELSFDVPGDVVDIGSFVYRQPFTPEVTEYEYDHVLLGPCPSLDECRPDPAEVMDLRLTAVDDLAAALVDHPERFTVWLPGALVLVLAHLGG